MGKIFAIGNQKINGQVSAYWNAVKPETMGSPDWTLRAQLVFMFLNKFVSFNKIKNNN